ncbi:hypothetical protein [Duganella vulcania]|uniref:Uncharacterized protein n=1 Tax=Duganella vulcania TaxID=2692166 RepID=A0A845GGL7_9BURK|nr:hypothetical protein [Duganella vulcania]MYM92535.1 hypothetical protein [Duganella vulcania]
MSKIRAQISFDDAGATIMPMGSNFTLKDKQGNEITFTLSALLRCMAIAEHEKLVPALPGEFWQQVEAKIKSN